jgi:acetyl-CoA carboxylase biotin carboxyl carrier protein
MAEVSGPDLEVVRALIRLAEEADLRELVVEAGGVRVRIRRAVAAQRPGAGARSAVTRGAAGPAAARPAAAPEKAPAPYAAFGEGLEEPFAPAGPAGEGEDRLAGTDHLRPITAPMVGTFYRAPAPDAPPFVSEGDVVQPGQTVCIIEAMKLFNEIQSEVAGRVARILVENGSPVEYGQPLILIEPASG